MSRVCHMVRRITAILAAVGIIFTCRGLNGAEAVSSLLEDDELRVRMGQVGQKLVREKFSIDVSLSTIVPVIREVLEQSGISFSAGWSS